MFVRKERRDVDHIKLLRLLFPSARVSYSARSSLYGDRLCYFILALLEKAREVIPSPVTEIVISPVSVTLKGASGRQLELGYMSSEGLYMKVRNLDTPTILKIPKAPSSELVLEVLRSLSSTLPESRHLRDSLSMLEKVLPLIDARLVMCELPFISVTIDRETPRYLLEPRETEQIAREAGLDTVVVLADRPRLGEVLPKACRQVRLLKKMRLLFEPDESPIAVIDVVQLSGQPATWVNAVYREGIHVEKESLPAALRLEVYPRRIEPYRHSITVVEGALVGSNSPWLEAATAYIDEPSDIVQCIQTLRNLQRLEVTCGWRRQIRRLRDKILERARTMF